MSSEIVKPAGTKVTASQGLTEEVSVGMEMSPTAAAAQAKAIIEARILHALRVPRDVDQFRLDLLKDCRRPGFAEAAIYKKPQGWKEGPEGRERNYITGFSVRFIEAALQHFMNYHVASRIGYDDADKCLLTVEVIDVQRNGGYSKDRMVDKLVERKEIKPGRKARGMRENSYGDLVYLVEATKDEFRNVLGAEESKLIRDNGKRLLPPDVLEEAWAVLEETLAKETARDPDSAKKKVLDKFAALGITAAQLKEYLGKDLEGLTAKDLQELTPLYNGLKEGSFTWADVMRAKDEPAEDPAKPRRRSARDVILQQPGFEAPPEEPKE